MGLLDDIFGKFFEKRAKKAAKDMQQEQQRELSTQEQIAADKEKFDAMREALSKAKIAAQSARPTPEMHAKVARLERSVIEMAQKLQQGDIESEKRIRLVSLGNKLLPVGFILFVIFMFGSTALVYKLSEKQANQ